LEKRSEKTGQVTTTTRLFTSQPLVACELVTGTAAHGHDFGKSAECRFARQAGAVKLPGLFEEPRHSGVRSSPFGIVR